MPSGGEARKQEKKEKTEGKSLRRGERRKRLLEMTRDGGIRKKLKDEEKEQRSGDVICSSFHVFCN